MAIREITARPRYEQGVVVVRDRDTGLRKRFSVASGNGVTGRDEQGAFVTTMMFQLSDGGLLSLVRGEGVTNCRHFLPGHGEGEPRNYRFDRYCASTMRRGFIGGG